MKREKLRDLGKIDHSEDDFMKTINFTEKQAEDLSNYLNIIANKIVQGDYTKSEVYQILYETLTIEELALACFHGLVAQINSHFDNKEGEKNNNEDEDLDKFLDSQI